MAISPLSDIVVDVLQAADPAKQQAASEKLNYMREAANAADFGVRLNEVSARQARSAMSTVRSALPESARLLEPTTAPVILGKSQDPVATPAVYKKFEAVVLQSFIEAMLPQQAEKIFGKGTAGSIWRSMLAEQLGNQLAKSGGVGIAKTLAIARPVADTGSAGPAQLGTVSTQLPTSILATDLLATDVRATKKSI